MLNHKISPLGIGAISAEIEWGKNSSYDKCQESVLFDLDCRAPKNSGDSPALQLGLLAPRLTCSVSLPKVYTETHDADGLHALHTGNYGVKDDYSKTVGAQFKVTNQRTGSLCPLSLSTVSHCLGKRVFFVPACS